MSMPVISATKTRWGTIPLIPADLTEPDNTHKNQGWQNAEEPPHSFFNYWMNVVYLWLVYLEGLQNEALTWTAAHVFNAGVTITGPAVALNVTQTATFDGAKFKGVGVGATGQAAVHVTAFTADGCNFNSRGLLVEADHGGFAAQFLNTGVGYCIEAEGVERSIYGQINTGDTTATASALGGVIGALGTSASPISWQAGVIGKGQLGETAGTMGIGANANSGTISGGRGARFIGGNQAGAASGGDGTISTGGNATGTTTTIAGRGATITGGNITNGAGNATGAAGYGAVIKGGDITGDTHGRLGGAALGLTGGLGQNGYGPAVFADHGGIVLAEGNIVADNNLVPHILGFMQVDGTLDVVGALSADSSLSVAGATVTNGTLTTNAPVTANATVTANSSLTVNGALTANAAINANAAVNVAGLLTPTGGIALEAVTAVTPTAPFTAGAQAPGFWKDALGIVGMQGGMTINTAVSLNPAFTLPVGYRPLQQCVFELPGDGSGNKNPATAIVHTTGVVNLRFGAVGGFVGDIFLDSIRFRTT